jgi:hypothetical protein
MRFSFVDAKKGEFAVVRLYEVLEVILHEKKIALRVNAVLGHGTEARRKIWLY